MEIWVQLRYGSDACSAWSVQNATHKAHMVGGLKVAAKEAAGASGCPLRGRLSCKERHAARGRNHGTDARQPRRAPTEAPSRAQASCSRLRDFNDTDLKHIPTLATGTRLQQDGTYIDLNAGPTPPEFTATGEMTAGPENCYVDKRLVAYEIWVA